MSTITEAPDPAARLLTFFLPQFHPIPENDEWWGKGFTEWTNVTKARPRFRGHYQPHYPAELGYYDLRVPEVREAQADLARRHGIHGFCYYHYWFMGRRLLERPVDEILESGRPDFPFCLCWPNESWTRNWTGNPKSVIIKQDHSLEDDLAHIRHLSRYFSDPRYIRIEGKPFFLVYSAERLPDARRTVDTWREEAHRLGIGDLFLARVESHNTGFRPEYSSHFDASVEFFPEWPTMGEMKRHIYKLPLMAFKHLRHWRSMIYDYETLMRNALAKPESNHEWFRCALVSWDNTARRETEATIVQGSTPKLYENWLAELIQRTREKPPERRIVFISSWNEWAEGNHLEPDQKWGRGYLEATRSALESARAPSTPAAPLAK